EELHEALKDQGRLGLERSVKIELRSANVAVRSPPGHFVVGGKQRQFRHARVGAFEMHEATTVEEDFAAAGALGNSKRTAVPGFFQFVREGDLALCAVRFRGRIIEMHSSVTAQK